MSRSSRLEQAGRAQVQELTRKIEIGAGAMHPDACALHARSGRSDSARHAARADDAGRYPGHADRLRRSHAAVDRRDPDAADADEPECLQRGLRAGRFDAVDIERDRHGSLAERQAGSTDAADELLGRLRRRNGACRPRRAGALRERTPRATSTTTWTSTCISPVAPAPATSRISSMRISATARSVQVPGAGGAAGPVDCRCQRRGHCRFRGQRPITTSMASSTCSSPTGSTCGRCSSAARTSCSVTTATRNRWIELDLVGTHSDRDAVGARVFATANGMTQLRIQNGGYHRWSQDMRRSHFGLGAAATVDLRVEWPSGAVQTLPDVATNKLYRITEGQWHCCGDAGCRSAGLPVWTASTERCGRRRHLSLAGLPERGMETESGRGRWRHQLRWNTHHDQRRLHERQTRRARE